MAYRQAWVEACASFDVCVRCGAAREKEKKCQKSYCWGCSEWHRAAVRESNARRKANPENYTPEAKAARTAERKARVTVERREQRAARRAAGVCANCGRVRGRDEEARGWAWCQRCRMTNERRGGAWRWKRRAARTTYLTEGRNGKPLTTGGGAGRIGAVRRLGITLDAGAYRALKLLTSQDRERRQARGQDVEMLFQASRIIRQGVLFWERRGTCPTRSPWHRKTIVFSVTFWADARCLAVIERFKGARGGNVSATVCDLITAAGNGPQWVAQAGGARTLPPLPEERYSAR